MEAMTLVRSAAKTRLQSIAGRGMQRGASLIIALIALVLMTIAGFSLMRSVDTGNVIAGNMAFRDVTVNASDLGIEAAAAYINTTIAPAPDADLPSGCTVPSPLDEPPIRGTCRYSARELPEDDHGIPFVDWASTASIPEITTGGVTYQYVVERLCNPDASVAVNTGKAVKYLQARDLCATAILDPGRSATGGSAYGRPEPSKTTSIHYRVTVRTRGPRNTVSFVQALLLR
ncbi:MAG: hypothetical protein QM739_03635 [Propionivibrio sp.]